MKTPKFLAIGKHPDGRLNLSKLFSAQTPKHYKACENHCFAHLFYGEIFEVVGYLLMYMNIGSMVSGLFTPPDVWPQRSYGEYIGVHVIVFAFAVLLRLSAQFARFTFTYADHFEREVKTDALLKTIGTGLPDAVRKMLEDAGIDPSQADVQVTKMPGGILKMISADMPDPDESPIDRLIRDANREAEKMRKKGGGSEPPVS